MDAIQYFSDIRLEILVIDNCSSDDTRLVVEKFMTDIPFLYYHVEEQQGLSYARNLGLEKSKGKWLLYLDDDVQVDKSIFFEIHKTVKNYDFVAFSGLVLPFYAEPKPKWLPPEFGTKRYMGEKYIDILDPQDYLIGCIYIIKKECLLEVGGFPVELGMKGNVIAYGEENYVEQHLRALNYILGYNEQIIVHHFIGEKKYKLSWHLRSAYAIGRDKYYIFKNDQRIQIFKVVGSLFPLLLIAPLKYIVCFFTKKDYYAQNLVLDIFSPVLVQLGILKSFIKSRIT